MLPLLASLASLAPLLLARALAGWPAFAALASLQARLLVYLFLRWFGSTHLLLPAAFSFFAHAAAFPHARASFISSPPHSRPSASFLRFLLGAPSRSSSFNFLSFAINCALVCFCLDASLRTHLFHPSHDLAFARVAAVGQDWANVHVRIPPSQNSSNPAASLFYRLAPLDQPLPFSNSSWIFAFDLSTSSASDWTAVAKLSHLRPASSYHYRLNSLHSNSSLHPLFPHLGLFNTAPNSDLLDQSNRGAFSFAYTSCIKPGFPYNPIRHPLHNDGALQLLDFIHHLPPSQNLDFILFLGDFIYIDSPFYPGHSIEHYHRKYRQSFASQGWKQLIQSTRLLHIYDDHEIYNNWAGQGNDSNPIFQSAHRAYRHYLGRANYDGPGSGLGDDDDDDDGENYYWFRFGDAAFFVLDCRRYRSLNELKDDHNKTMLGTKQKHLFLDWLEAVNSTVTFKFVISSTPFMTVWSGFDGDLDTWAGFKTERSELLDVMEFVPNLIILSGDRHEFAAAKIRESIIEFSTSPLNQFWLPIKTLHQDHGLGITGEDQVLKYLPNGNHKFSSLRVDSTDVNQPFVQFDLYIDGKLAYNLTYLGQPIQPQIKQVGKLLVQHWDEILKELLSKII